MTNSDLPRELAGSLAKDLAHHAKSWPFEEARRILARCHHHVPPKGYILLETGYGPSGLPHIGTFGEVLRTSMVRKALAELSDIPTRLFAFSDDMDGLRKVPDNVPNQDMLHQNLGKPLTAIPDPFGEFESFADHNNHMLRRFLDSFGFEYEFKSSTECYRSGLFDDTIRLVLQHYDEVLAVMLPTLREERRKTYSPFLPVCPDTGKVLQVPISHRNVDAGTIAFENEAGKWVEVPVTGGHCKLQWKVDWAMRWRAFTVDYEMCGKDLIDSLKLSSQICRILGGRPPENLTYELFLDEKGEKISKSRGNGLTIDEWLTYAPTESLAYYMFQSPKKAKRLYFDVIPKNVDEYLGLLAAYPGQAPQAQIDNPVWHVHKGKVPLPESVLSFNIILNLVSVCHSEDPLVIWGFVSRYVAGASPERFPFLDRLIQHAIAYYRDFVQPHKQYRAPTEVERVALRDLQKTLQDLPPTTSAEDIQTQVYEVGKRHAFTDLRAWFGALYEVLLGQKEGPRLGSFIALYGLAETTALIEERLQS